MSASVEFEGIEEIIRAFGHAPQIVREELTRHVPPELKAMARSAAIYPAKRARQRYIRTGALGRGWVNAAARLVATAQGIVARLTNPVGHVGWVQGERQAWMHKGRWTPLATIQTEHELDTQNAAEKAVTAIARRLEHP